MISNWVLRKWKVIVLIFLIFAVLAILITATSENPISVFILRYFNDWSIALSAGVMIFLAITAVWNIADNRRMRVEEAHRLAFLRIRDWAEKASDALATPTKEFLFSEQKSEELTKLQLSMSLAGGILRDAERLEGTLNDKVIDAVFLLQKYHVRLMGEEQIKGWKDKHAPQEDIKPFQSYEEMHAPIKELLTTLNNVTKSATEKLVPKL